MVVSFGTMFNNVRLVRYDASGVSEIERITVPLIYANKEKYYLRITQDPELTKETQINEPKMSFEMTNISYDPLRKTSSYNQLFATNKDRNLVSTKIAPYNFDFTLSIYIRNVEDGTQIIEQILPYFSPDYTLSLNITDLPTKKYEVPIVLNSINQNVQATGGPQETRYMTWDLSFTVKGYLYGPVNDSKIIKEVNANTFYYNTDVSGFKSIKLDLDNGEGNFKIGELVYEGQRLGHANSSAFVTSWDPVNGILDVVDLNGFLNAGFMLKGAVSDANWQIVSFNQNQQLANINIKPDPTWANPDDDFGFTTNYTEFT